MADPNFVVEFTDGSKTTIEMVTKEDDVYQLRIGKEKVPVEGDKIEALHAVSHTEWGPRGTGELHTEDGDVYDVPFEKQGIAQEILR
ncbi:MAG: hypothetical protein U5J64_00195 [Halobacteriales archaeon]|nr:hypothetical protein [Halobacteriales archaeon]